MTRVVLSIGSNLGDRLARLQSVVDALGEAVIAVSPVYETDPWGGVDQGPFLNAVVIAEDGRRDAQDWLGFAQDLERAVDDPPGHLGGIELHRRRAGMDQLAVQAAVDLPGHAVDHALGRHDLDALAVLQRGVEGHQIAVNARTAAAVANVGVQAIGEIHRRCTARQIDHAALGRQHVDGVVQGGAFELLDPVGGVGHFITQRGIAGAPLLPCRRGVAAVVETFQQG